MSFASICKDKLTLVKADGTVHPKDIKAMVQAKGIFVFDKTIPFEAGDHVLRQLPNGLVEDYLIQDAHYQSAPSDDMAHFKLTVVRGAAGPQSATSAITNITNNIYGDGGRINIGSTDNSSNTIVKDHSVFSELLNVASRIPDESERKAVTSAIEEMRVSAGTDSFKSKYQAFIGTAANHMSLFGPALPALANFL